MTESGTEAVLPFRGRRQYVPLADLMAHAIGAAEAPAACPVTASAYRMIRSPCLSVVRSETPLSPREHDAIVSLGSHIHVGYTGRPNDGSAQAIECYEAAQRPHITVGTQDGLVTAEAAHMPEVGASLPFWLIAAIKAASIDAFAARGGRWIAAKAILQQVPPRWRSARMTTPAPANARVFPWAVEIDGQASGEVLFFNEPVAA